MFQFNLLPLSCQTQMCMKLFSKGKLYSSYHKLNSLNIAMQSSSLYRSLNKFSTTTDPKLCFECHDKLLNFYCTRFLSIFWSTEIIIERFGHLLERVNRSTRKLLLPHSQVTSLRSARPLFIIGH